MRGQDRSDSAVAAMGDAKLRLIAAELITQMKKSLLIDWTLRESAHARIRVMVKRLLNRYGYPTAAAWRFAAALRETGDASAFLACFLSTQHQAEPLASAEQAADAEYRYLVQLLPGTDPHLHLQCWRRPPGGTSWNPRCGPMPLEVFTRRFLPGEPP